MLLHDIKCAKLSAKSASNPLAVITRCIHDVLYWMPNTVTVELPPGKLFTCPGLDWHLKHETGLNDNVCREGIKLEEALRPLLNLACEERIVFICITRHMNTIATKKKKL